MVVQITGIQGGGSAVVGAIREAARTTGTNFEYLLATAQVESGFNPNASATSSSARGLFQFIEQTWLSTLKEAGPSLGYGRYADAITKAPSGRYGALDAVSRSEILALRHDPAANAAMAGAFTKRNAALLTKRLGRSPSEGELYVAHFLGASGAARLITLAGEDPGAIAATVFPNAAKANRSIFYDKLGRPRTAAEVYGGLVGRYDIARAGPQEPSSGMVAASRADGAQVAMAAPLGTEPPAPAQPAADDWPVFHGLFRDDGPRAVSQIIQDLWATRPHVAAALTGQSAPSAPAPSMSRAPLDLFLDQRPDAQALFGART